MRTIAVLLIASAALHGAEAAGEKAVTAVVERLFRAMSDHDAEALGAVLTPEGRYFAVRENGAVSGGTHAEFIARIAAAKEALVERMWDPRVLIQGRIAVLWAPYDFHRDGKFSHCGIDSFSLVETAGGWKIAGVTYTVQQSGCPASPLGPLRK